MIDNISWLAVYPEIILMVVMNFCEMLVLVLAYPWLKSKLNLVICCKKLLIF